MKHRRPPRKSMAKPNPPTAGPDSSGPKLRTTIGLRPDQDRWLSELLGEKGNVSAFFQNTIDAMMQGIVDLKPLMKGQRDLSAVVRAEMYLKAKEAALYFEEDVGECIERWLNNNGRRAMHVTRNRIHNGTGTFVADFSIENGTSDVIFSVQCKSSPRSDRLQLALAEAMIGTQKTGKPVLSVVPYLTSDSTEVQKQFPLVGQKLVVLSDLTNAMDALLKDSRTRTAS